MVKLEGPQLWAEKLKKNSSTAKRYMQNGIIPNAEQTPGGHWRAPFSEGLLEQVAERLERKEGYTYCRSPREVTAELEKVFTPHSLIRRRESLPFRIGCALTLAGNREEVTFENLNYIDGLFREGIDSGNPLGAFRAAARKSKTLASYIPEKGYIEVCRAEVAAGRAVRIALVAAHAHALVATHTEATEVYWELVLKYWRIIWGKKIANQEDQEWYVDENNFFRPRLKWKQGSPSTFHRICPREMQLEAYVNAVDLLGITPPDIPAPKQRKQTNHEPRPVRCSQ